MRYWPNDGAAELATERGPENHSSVGGVSDADSVYQRHVVRPRNAASGSETPPTNFGAEPTPWQSVTPPAPLAMLALPDDEVHG